MAAELPNGAQRAFVGHTHEEKAHMNLENAPSSGVTAGTGYSIRGTGLLRQLAQLLIPFLVAVSLGLIATSTPAAAQTVPAAGAAPLGTTAYPVPAGAKFVSLLGSDANAGTESAPWRTLAYAVKTAAAGSTIVLRAGTYRESVQFYAKTLTIQSYPNEAVWLSGSDVVTGWVADGSAWRKDGWTAQFDRTDNTGVMVDPAYPLAAWPDMVFMDGAAKRQVANRAEVVAGTFFVDYAAAKLYVGDNPSGRTVEASTRTDAIYVNTSPNSVVRGLGIKHYATPVAKVAALKGFADNVTFENNVVTQNAMTGLSVIGHDGKVRNNTATDNGQLGLHAHKADRLLMSGNLVQRNNAERFVMGQAAGGVKITTARDATISGNRVESNLGNGIWLDVSSWAAKFVHNYVRGNARHGIMYEISANAIVADNVVLENAEHGIYVLDSSDVNVWNNTLLRNKRNIQILEGPRTSSVDPAITHDVDRITVRNNVMSDGNTGSVSMFGVDDARKQESGSAMGITTNYNAYHRSTATSPQWSDNWSNWPTNMLAFNTLGQFQAATSQEMQGWAADNTTNPFVASETTGNFGLPATSPAKSKGLPLPANVAAAIGVPAGVAVDIGVLTFGGTGNQTPTAGMSASCSLLTCNLDGSSSVDSDGTISSWAWTFGDGATATGKTTSRSYAAAGTYTVTLTVTDNGGATASTNRTVTVAAAVTEANDTYSRSVVNGWGSADAGGGYTVTAAGESSFAVNAGVGTINVPAAGTGRSAQLQSVSQSDVELAATVSTDKLVAGGTYGQTISLVGRRVASNTEYRARLRLAPDGNVYLALAKLTGTSTETILGSEALVPGLTQSPGAFITVKASMISANPTTLATKAWRSGLAEPSSWQVTATDAEAALQSPGAVGLVTWMSAVATNAPVTWTVDNFSARKGTAVPAAPAAPTSLTATAVSTSQVNLQWQASSGATGYRVERSTNGSTTWTEVAAGITGTSWSNSGLASSTGYSFRVRATNSAGTSPYSNVATATTLLAVPSTPTGLVATPVSKSQINLTWSRASGAASYKVERSTDGANWVQVASGVSSTSYSSTSLQRSTTYYFRIRATNASGDSPYSSTVVTRTTR